MSKRIADQIEELFLSVLDEKYELVDVEYVKEGAFYYLRVFIDKDGGLDIDEISDITRVLNKLLDEKDPIQQQYFLEVSTPGLGRALKKERDFIRESGKEIELKLYQPVNGQKELFGVLIGLDETGNIVIQSEDEQLCLSKKDIASIKLKVDF